MITEQVDRLLVRGVQLTLVHDPDAILQDETLLVNLTERGFRFIRERDAVALHAEIERHRSDAAQPLAVITSYALDALSYDLWQQGRHVTLALEDLFPKLDTYHVGELRPAQRARLATAYEAHPPGRPLSPVETQDYPLRRHFGASMPAVEEWMLAVAEDASC